MTSYIYEKHARQLFEKLMVKSSMKRFFSTITGKRNDLHLYQTERDTLEMASQHYGGGQSIPINQIQGSFNRCEDFDINFLPKNSNSKERWVSIAAAMYQDKALPAIKVYLIGDTYFVEDGHHRVSAARALGRLFIDAIVTEIDSPVLDVA